MIEQTKEEKDNEFEGHETTVRTLKTELTDGNQQIQRLKEERVIVYMCITLCQGLTNLNMWLNRLKFTGKTNRLKVSLQNAYFYYF